MHHVIAYSDKNKRDEVYHDLRQNGDRLERRVVRYSEAEPMMNAEVAGEILLDAAGHTRYVTLWCVAYPTK